MLNTSIADRVRGGWSIPCARVDGTDALADVRGDPRRRRAARAGEGPQCVEAVTLRGHGHAAHDDAGYVPEALRAQFGDPIDRLAARLRLDGLSEDDVEARRRAAAVAVAAGLAEAEAAPQPDPADARGRRLRDADRLSRTSRWHRAW